MGECGVAAVGGWFTAELFVLSFCGGPHRVIYTHRNSLYRMVWRGNTIACKYTVRVFVKDFFVFRWLTRFVVLFAF